MRVLTDYDDNVELYLNKHYDEVINFEDKDDLEIYFRELFLKLKRYYNVNLIGFYNITIYNDKNYGNIIKIDNDNFDYCDYFGNQIDMKISIEKDSTFVYKITDILNFNENLLYKLKTYKFKNNLYVAIDTNLNEKETAFLIENSDIVYGDEVSDIINKGILINNILSKVA